MYCASTEHTTTKWSKHVIPFNVTARWTFFLFRRRERVTHCACADANVYSQRQHDPTINLCPSYLKVFPFFNCVPHLFGHLYPYEYCISNKIRLCTPRKLTKGLTYLRRGDVYLIYPINGRKTWRSCVSNSFDGWPLRGTDVSSCVPKASFLSRMPFMVSQANVTSVFGHWIRFFLCQHRNFKLFSPERVTQWSHDRDWPIGCLLTNRHYIKGVFSAMEFLSGDWWKVEATLNLCHDMDSVCHPALEDYQSTPQTSVAGYKIVFDIVCYRVYDE